MIYLGIDPSFTKTGLTYLDIDNKTILFVALSPPGTNENYIKTIERSAYVASEVVSRLDIKSSVKIIVEEPLAMSMKASRLGILSGYLSKVLLGQEQVKNIYMITPTYIAHLNSSIAKRKGLSKKQASLYVVNKILEHFEEEGYDITIHNDKYLKDGSVKKRKLSHDEAESFLLLLVLLKKLDLIDDKLNEKLISINRKFVKWPDIEILK